MTGRDLIIYILQNNLEDEVVLKDGLFVGFMDEQEAATKFSVGIETIRVWHSLGMLYDFRFGDKLYFLQSATDPRKGEMTNER